MKLIFSSNKPEEMSAANDNTSQIEEIATAAIAGGTPTASTGTTNVGHTGNT